MEFIICLVLDAMSSERARRWYHNRKKMLKKMYWGNNDGSDILAPNGFKEYPEGIYNVFLSIIDRDGNIIDLGCGNGLLLKHLVTKSKHKLTPYGVDFIEESINQAKTIILPKYKDNFIIGNIVEIELKENMFDIIIFDPTAIHVDDHEITIRKILRVCRKGGKIIFYVYKDMLRILKIVKLIPLLEWLVQIKVYGYPRWVGDLLPNYIRDRIYRIDHKDVSIGVYTC